MIFTENTDYQLDGLKQDLPGFDAKYVNIVDYILKITEEIWENRAIWVIYETYTDDVVIYNGATTIKGVETVVTGTLKTLASFPDRKMGAEAVIWSKIKDNHFYSSHRIASTATNLGATAFGAATGRTVFFRTIADCVVTDNKIYEEWLVRDNLSLVQQLGFDAVAMAKLDTRYKNGTSIPTAYVSEEFEKTNLLDTENLDISQPNDLVIALFKNCWKNRNFNDFHELEKYYDNSSQFHGICNQELMGSVQIGAYLNHLWASFPEANIQLERVSSNQKGDKTEVAARWKITGKHTGDGFFSPASGKEIMLLGISHYIVKNAKIVEEWTIFDGFDLLCQIHA